VLSKTCRVRFPAVLFSLIYISSKGCVSTTETSVVYRSWLAGSSHSSAAVLHGPGGRIFPKEQLFDQRVTAFRRKGLTFSVIAFARKSVLDLVVKPHRTVSCHSTAGNAKSCREAIASTASPGKDNRGPNLNRISPWILVSSEGLKQYLSV